MKIVLKKKIEKIIGYNIIIINNKHIHIHTNMCKFTNYRDTSNKLDTDTDIDSDSNSDYSILDSYKYYIPDGMNKSIEKIIKLLIEKNSIINDKMKNTNINNNSINDSVDNELCELLNETTLDDIKSNKIKDKEEILELIKSNISERFTDDIFKSLKTKSGNTQQPERNYIEIIKSLFNDLELTYTQAGTQQSKDFRNVNNTGLNIEVKKTDGYKVICNDTCPSEDIEYLIIFTGTTNFKPQILFINGLKIIEDCDWLSDFQERLNNNKDLFCRGENAKNLNGLLEAYLRPTYKFPINTLLT